MGLRPTKLGENWAGADSVLWSLRCPAGACSGPPRTPTSPSHRSLREIADSTKRSLRQPRLSYFRPCGFSQAHGRTADLEEQVRATSPNPLTHLWQNPRGAVFLTGQFLGLFVPDDAFVLGIPVDGAFGFVRDHRQVASRDGLAADFHVGGRPLLRSGYSRRNSARGRSGSWDQWKCQFLPCLRTRAGVARPLAAEAACAAGRLDGAAPPPNW